MKSRFTPQGEITLNALAPKFAKAAQAVYDEWDQDEEGFDEEYGSGGICDTIAEALCDVLGEAKVALDYMTKHIESDNHTLAFVKMPDGVYSVDIPPGAYETGGWYNYKKRKDVEIGADDVVVDRVDADPEAWERYEED